MKLTRAADYAIRMLIQLASGGSERTSLELAKRLNIPFNHIAKIVQNLSRNGYLITKKGKGGGISLARDPKKISVYDIVSAIEGPLVVSDCILNRETCKFSRSCNFRDCLADLKGKIEELLSSTSIFDLVGCK